MSDTDGFSSGDQTSSPEHGGETGPQFQLGPEQPVEAPPVQEQASPPAQPERDWSRAPSIDQPPAVAWAPPPVQGAPPAGGWAQPPAPFQTSTYGNQGFINRLVPAQNPDALIAYYMGVFALIPCVGVILAVVAIIFGVRGLGACKRSPGLPGKGHAITGIVMGTLVIIGHLLVTLFLLYGNPMGPNS